MWHKSSTGEDFVEEPTRGTRSRTYTLSRLLATLTRHFNIGAFIVATDIPPKYQQHDLPSLCNLMCRGAEKEKNLALHWRRCNMNPPLRSSIMRRSAHSFLESGGDSIGKCRSQTQFDRNSCHSITICFRKAFQMQLLSLLNTDD